jgi:hypothetical protein
MKLFVCISDDAEGLLPHFLNHYGSRGIQEFHIAAPHALQSQIRDASGEHKLFLYSDLDISSCYIDGGAPVIAEMRRQRQATDEWVMIVDLDEFVEISEPASELIREFDAEGATVGTGIMYDRFTLSGELLGFSAASTLREAFPIKARFVRDVMGADERKGIFVKAHLKGEGAHHHFTGERMASKVLEISHYRFHGRSLDRLRASYKRVREQGILWADQYKAALDHFDKHGRFAWETFGGERDDLLLEDHHPRSRGWRTDTKEAGEVSAPQILRFAREITNVALNKPAIQSSVSRWSIGDTIEADASIATNGDTVSNKFFHTEFEFEPWWQVDLEDEFVITQIRVFNRRDVAERMKHFTVLVSLTGDSGTWLEVGRKDTDVIYGRDDVPYTITPVGRNTARFVRIRLDSFLGTLHFRECEVLGYRSAVHERTGRGGGGR